jgi:aminopeptidase
METHNMETLLSRYATLLVKHGANVQPGQIVNIAAEVCHRDFAYRVAQEAYKAGASTVILDLAEPRLQRFKLDTVKDEFVSLIPKHTSAKYQQILDEGGANIKILGPEFPLLLAEVSPKRVNDERLAFYNAVKPFYQEGIGKSKVHWTIGAAATPAWGKRVFPELSESAALKALWESIFSIVRVDREDFLQGWKEHNTTLHKRARLLNELSIKALHFSGPGTDLSVALSERARWKGGTDNGPTGQPFEPNIPTEECFTTPDCRATNGTVRATRPFLVNGVLVEGLSLVFKDGVIVSFEAKAGGETFREYIDSDPGGRQLGEVALVGIDSPIFKSGRVFEEILFDENAACHIAVGSAYKFCLNGGDTLTKEELAAIGCNESSVHTDMMISNEHVSVEAELYRGGKVTLLKNGEWQGDFR